jgi:hypothetical protein
MPNGWKLFSLHLVKRSEILGVGAFQAKVADFEGT